MSLSNKAPFCQCPTSEQKPQDVSLPVSLPGPLSAVLSPQENLLALTGYLKALAAASNQGYWHFFVEPNK